MLSLLLIRLEYIKLTSYFLDNGEDSQEQDWGFWGMDLEEVGGNTVDGFFKELAKEE